MNMPSLLIPALEMNFNIVMNLVLIALLVILSWLFHIIAKRKVGKERSAVLKNDKIIDRFSSRYESTYLINPKTNEFRVIKRAKRFSEYPEQEPFSDSIQKYIDRDIYPPDREKVRAAVDRGFILHTLKEEESHSVYFRDISGGAPIWYLMRYSFLSDNSEVLMGFANVNDQMMSEMVNNKLLGEYMAVFLVGLSSDIVRVYKGADLFDSSETDTNKKWKDLAASLKESCEDDYLAVIEKISTIESIRNELSASDFREYVYKAKDSDKSWRRIVLSSAERIDGEPVCAILAITNLDDFSAENADLNLKLEEALHKAQMASKLKSHFVQNLSHDIRTPLNAIVGYSQLLCQPDGYITDEEKVEYCDYIDSSVEMLTLFVDDVLSMSDIENDNIRIELDEARCNEMGNKTVQCSRMIALSGVKVYFTSDVDDSYSILTDEKRVQEILINLLSNACKNTARGEIRVHCSAKENPGYITYSVTDTGCGVPESVADDLFKHFTSLVQTESVHGLGLSICHNLAVRLGGDVRLDTSYRFGARFLLLLPTKERDALPQEEYDRIRNMLPGTWHFEGDEFYVIGHSAPLVTYNAASDCEITINPDLTFVVRDVNSLGEETLLKGFCTLYPDGSFVYEESDGQKNIRSNPRHIARIDKDIFIYRVDSKDFHDPFSSYPDDLESKYDYDLAWYKRINKTII